jgi:hypothetical protein
MESVHIWRRGCQPYALATIFSQEDSKYSFLLRDWVDPRAIVRLEGLGELRNPMTHREWNPRPSYLEDSGSSNYITAYPKPRVKTNNFQFGFNELLSLCRLQYIHHTYIYWMLLYNRCSNATSTVLLEHHQVITVMWQIEKQSKFVYELILFFQLYCLALFRAIYHIHACLDSASPGGMLTGQLWHSRHWSLCGRVPSKLGIHCSQITNKLVDRLLARQAVWVVTACGSFLTTETYELLSPLASGCFPLCFSKRCDHPLPTACGRSVNGWDTVFLAPNLTLRYEGVWGRGCIDPHFLDLGTTWRWVISFNRIGLSGRRGEEKVLDPTGTRTPTTH